MMIIRLNMFLQFQGCITTLENDTFAREHLVKSLLRSFDDRRWLCHSVKNLLRFSKGKGFKEMVYMGVKDTTFSKLFLLKIRASLLNFEDETTANFMNAVFNALNDVTSELFMVIKEVRGLSLGNHNHILRRIKYYLDLIIDLSRVLELLTRWVPELFLCKDQIHASRLLDFVLFVFRSIFRMQMDELFIEFCDKLQSKSRSLAQVLAPFIGILNNLYEAIGVLKNEPQNPALLATGNLSPDLAKLKENL